MLDFFIVIVLFIMVVIGAYGSMKHLKGEGGCCGGTSAKPKRKKLKNKIVRRYVFYIEGMHCNNCVNTVTREINSIEGASARVNLRKKSAVVVCDRPISADTIVNAVRRRGYGIVENK